MPNATHIIAWKDGGTKGMIPASKGGVILAFPTTDKGMEAARYAAGPLGTPAPVTTRRLREVAKRFGLNLPEKGR